MSFNIEVEGGTSVRLPTAGKYCDRDILVTAKGGGGEGYDQGYADGERAATAAAEAHNAIILADCNAVLPTKGVEPAETLEQVPDRIEEIETGGGGSDNFLLENAVVVKFTGVEFPADTEMNLTFSKTVTDFASFLSNTRHVKKVKLKGSFTGKCSLLQMFYYSQELEEIDISELNAVGRGFGGENMANLLTTNRKLKTIVGELDFSVTKHTNQLFYLCEKLENVRFKANSLSIALSLSHSSLLTDESIQSIIDGLADLTGQTTQTLTLHKDVGAKLTDAQKATITAKNWTLAY